MVQTIKAENVRYIDENGVASVISKAEIERIAAENEQDIIVISEKDVPVVKLGDMKKYLYEKQREAKQASKKNKSLIVEKKEIRLSPNIDEHDMDTKARQAKQFIDKGNTVVVCLKFKGREAKHVNSGVEIVERFASKVENAVASNIKTSGNVVIANLTKK